MYFGGRITGFLFSTHLLILQLVEFKNRKTVVQEVFSKYAVLIVTKAGNSHNSHKNFQAFVTYNSANFGTISCTPVFSFLNSTNWRIKRWAKTRMIKQKVKQVEKLEICKKNRQNGISPTKIPEFVNVRQVISHKRAKMARK